LEYLLVGAVEISMSFQDHDLSYYASDSPILHTYSFLPAVLPGLLDMRRLVELGNSCGSAQHPTREVVVATCEQKLEVSEV
jgi:hypothetical protein